MAIRAGARDDGARAGGVEPLGAVPLRQPEEPETGAIALLGMRAAFQNRRDEPFGRTADRRSPVDQARGTPLRMGAVRLGHVGRDRGVTPGQEAAHVQPHADATQEHVDRRGGQADLDVGMDQRVRHGVVVPVDLDVIVDVDARVAPFRVDVAIERKRVQGRPIEPLEERAAGLAAVPLHRAEVQIGEQLRDPCVEGEEREEGFVSQPRQNPALRDLDGDLDLRFVPGLGRARGQDGRAVVARPVLVGPLDRRLIPARSGDAGPELIRHDHRGDAAEKLHGPRVTLNEVDAALGARGFRVRVVGRAKHGHEEFHRHDLAGRRIDQ